MVDWVIELIQDILQVSDDPPPAKKSASQVSLEQQKENRKAATRSRRTGSNAGLLPRLWTDLSLASLSPGSSPPLIL